MQSFLSPATILNLSFNNISVIPLGLPQNLVALDLSKNKLNHLSGFESIQNLKELYLGGNNIERLFIAYLCHISKVVISTWGLTVAVSLEILDLSANKIKLVEGKLCNHAILSKS